MNIDFNLTASSLTYASKLHNFRVMKPKYSLGFAKYDAYVERSRNYKHYSSKECYLQSDIFAASDEEFSS